MTTPDTIRRREERVRRTARRYGLVVRKSRRQSQGAPELHRYWLVCPFRRMLVCGDNWSHSLEEVEEWLADRERH